jgi:hypothetical protein
MSANQDGDGLPVVETMVRLGRRYNDELRAMEPGRKYQPGGDVGREYQHAVALLYARTGLMPSELDAYFGPLASGDRVPTADVVGHVLPALATVDAESLRRDLLAEFPHLAAVVSPPRRSPPLSLSQFGEALVMDARTFKKQAQKEWDLQAHGQSNQRWTVDYDRMNPSDVARIEDQAKRLRQGQIAKRKNRTAK